MSRRSRNESAKAQFKLNEADAAIVVIKEPNITAIAQRMADAALRCGIRMAVATTSDGYMRIWGMHKNLVTWGVHWRSDWHHRMDHKVLYIENALLHQKLGIFVDHMGYFGDSSITVEPQPAPTSAEIARMKTHCKQAFPWSWLEGGKPNGPIMAVCQTHNDTSVRWHNFPDRNGLKEGSIEALLRLCSPLRGKKVIVRPHPKAVEHFKDQSSRFDWPKSWSVDTTPNVYETLRRCSGLVTATSTLATEALSLGIPVACLGRAAWAGYGVVMECSGNTDRVAKMLEWKPDGNRVVEYLCAVMRHQIAYTASVDDILDNESFRRWIGSIGGEVPAERPPLELEAMRGSKSKPRPPKEMAAAPARQLNQTDPEKVKVSMGSARACRLIMDNAPVGSKIIEYGAGLGDWSAYLAVAAHNAGRHIRLEVYDPFVMLGSGDAFWRLPHVAKVRKPGEMTTKGICRRRLARTKADHIIKAAGKSTRLAKSQRAQSVWAIWFTKGHERSDACLSAWWDTLVPGGWLATHADDTSFPGLRSAFQTMAISLNLNLVELDNSLFLRKPPVEGENPIIVSPPEVPHAPASRPTTGGQLDDTALILTYANSEESGLRQKATAEALTHLLALSPTPFVVFHELVFPGQDPQFEEMFKSRKHAIHTCIRGTDLNRGAWPKEALYELAVKSLPAQYIYLIFGDADMYPDRADFASRVHEVLADRNVLLQAYSSWSDTKNTCYTKRPSFASAPIGKGSPGGYWAMRRSLHSRLGGFCTTAFAGGADGLVPLNWTSTSLAVSHAKFKSYSSLIKPVDDKPDLECLATHMTHVFHGKHSAPRREEGTRAYQWRYWVVDLDGRNISDIIEMDAQELPSYIHPNDPLAYCMTHKADMFSEKSARVTYAKGVELQQAVSASAILIPASKSTEHDQAWWIANPPGGMGSAMRGAISRLRKIGVDVLVASKSTRMTPKLMASSRVWVLGGLPIRMHDRIRAVSSEIEIIFQCHSPWLFLANEKGDFDLYSKALDLCTKHTNTFMSHVAEREYVDACAAFGYERMRLIPAIYEGEISSDPGEMGGPVVVAHQARPGKNLAGQLLAGARAADALGVPLHWYCSSDLSRTSQIIRVWSMIPKLYPKLEAVTKGWVTQRKFRAACREASVGMCATWTDAYSQVACDFLSQSTPIVASPAQWFCREWSVCPDDIPVMSGKAFELARDPDARARASGILVEAQTVQEAHLERWRRSLG